jgi:hypothetical protein
MFCVLSIAEWMVNGHTQIRVHMGWLYRYSSTIVVDQLVLMMNLCKLALRKYGPCSGYHGAG